MKPEALAAAAALAGAAAIGAFVHTGAIYDAIGDTCTKSTARGPCEYAQALSADPDDCRPGSVVYRRVEQRFDPDGGLTGGTLPPGFSSVTGSTVEVPCYSLRRPSKALTAVKASAPDCIVGEWVTDAGAWNGRREASKCCQPGCRCAGRCVSVVPVVVAGADDTHERLCEAVPEHPSCDAGMP